MLFSRTIFISSLRICIGGLIGFWSSWLYRLFVAASRPSKCGMFVYSDETSMLTSLQLIGTLVVVIRVAKSVLSLMNDGRLFIIGCSQKSINFEIFSVILLML